MQVQKIWDAADGSATPGRVFTASLPQEAIPAFGTKLDYLKIGMKGTISSAAVTIESFATLVSPFTLRFGSENRITANLDELCALMAFYYKELPAIGENTDATGNDFIGGLKVPVYQAADASKQFLIQADYAAVTNVATSTLGVSGYWDTGDDTRKPVHMVRIAHTSSGTAGLETLGSRIVPAGNLVGLIVKEPNGFADGNIDTSVQRVKILADGKVVAELNDLSDHTPVDHLDYVTPSPLSDLLRQFRMFDLRPAGLDAKAQQLTIQIDVQDVSDSLVFLPVLEIA
jgi:hypothetical protein